MTCEKLPVNNDIYFLNEKREEKISVVKALHNCALLHKRKEKMSKKRRYILKLKTTQY